MLARLFHQLAPFQPTLIGSFPIGLQVDGSDLDIACACDDLDAFERALRTALSDLGIARSRIERSPAPAVVAAFELDGNAIEITKQDGKMVDRESDSAKRKERAGWSDPKAPSRGWQVDEVETGKSPFYVSDPLYGNDGSSTKVAKLRDTPGEWTTDKNVGAEFRTCAVSYAGGKGTVLACVDWGYYLDDTGKVLFYPAKPTAYPGAVPQVLDATKRWDAIAGTTKANIVK